MRNYELVIVLDGKTTAAKKKSVTEKFTKFVEETKGKVGKIVDWGTRDLSYKIKKSLSGVYLILPLELESQAAKDLAVKLKLDNDLIRYLLVRKD
jgi:small subunit ribosomal protein S6